MRRSHSHPISAPLLRVLIVLALLLFFAAFLYRCSAQPQICSGRGYVLFLPVGTSGPLPVLSPWG